MPVAAVIPVVAGLASIAGSVMSMSRGSPSAPQQQAVPSAWNQGANTPGAVSGGTGRSAESTEAVPSTYTAGTGLGVGLGAASPQRTAVSGAAIPDVLKS